MTEPQSQPTPAISSAILFGAGVVYLAAALAYNEIVVELIRPLDDAARQNVRVTQLGFGLIGAALLGVSVGVRRVSRRLGWVEPGLLSRLLLLGLALIVPASIAELALRPLVPAEPAKTTIFLRDAELGWRLRPNAVDLWGGVPIRINAKGLRGPELAYAKPPGILRILYLGDSVTFGFRIPEYDQTFPQRTEVWLERRMGPVIETLNGGVDGYSQWQQLAYLAREGTRYDPDLVVVAFVLNDVTEMFGLTRFGGGWDGFQLDRTAEPIDWFVARSAVVRAGRRLFARLRFGTDPAAGAKRRELLDVHDLVAAPDSTAVRRAWSVALADLARIVELCRTRGIQVGLVAFPFAFQLGDPDRFGAPQRVLREFATEMRVPLLDLLPVLASRLRSHGLAEQALFLDENHPSVHGNAVIAEIVGEFLQREQLLKRPSVRGAEPADPGKPR